MSEDKLKLREIILNTSKPIVLKNFDTKWKFSDLTLEDWCQLFDEERNGIEMDFERMRVNSSTRHPQWERERIAVKMTMKQFFEEHKNQSQDYWTGLNYKSIDEIPEKCKMGINFSCFGFQNLTEEHARFWLSSAGANTPCHQDTYGCNIVVQVYGSKFWLLFPPNTSLTTTRLPYEESSIYCMENFYAPAPEQIHDLQRLKSEAYLYHLKAGDVLIVPRNWWHFVETVELSLSINAWIPLKVDSEAQLEECIVKYLMETLVRHEDSSVMKYILNPNQEELCSEEEILNILKFLCDNMSADINEKGTKTSKISYPYQYLEDQKVYSMLKDFSNAFFVPKTSFESYNTFIMRNSTRFVNEITDVAFSPISDMKQALINSICSGSVVKETARQLLKRYEKMKVSKSNFERNIDT